jgi:hypothetical protein
LDDSACAVGAGAGVGVAVAAVGINLLIPHKYRTNIDLLTSSSAIGGDSCNGSTTAADEPLGGDKRAALVSFGLPHKVAAPLARAITAGNRWVDPTALRSLVGDQVQSETRAFPVKFAWLLPNEHPHGPHGGFAYQLQYAGDNAGVGESAGGEVLFTRTSSGQGTTNVGNNGECDIVFFPVAEV